MTEHIRTTVADGVLRVVMARPEKKNALTLPMYAAMTAALARASADDAVRVIVIEGAHGCFTAGNDLGDFMRARTADDLRDTLDFLAALAEVDKPLVAIVDGLAVGVGTTMLLHCDLVYASDSARFKLPFVSLGLTPEAGSTLLLPATIGRRAAAEMLLLGDELSADRALALGLVTRVVAGARLRDHADAAIRRLAAQPPSALAATKRLLARIDRDQLRETIAVECEEFVARLQSAEAAEAFRAFAARRPPTHD